MTIRRDDMRLRETCPDVGRTLLYETMWPVGRVFKNVVLDGSPKRWRTNIGRDEFSYRDRDRRFFYEKNKQQTPTGTDEDGSWDLHPFWSPRTRVAGKRFCGGEQAKRAVRGRMNDVAGTYLRGSCSSREERVEPDGVEKRSIGCSGKYPVRSIDTANYRLSIGR